MSRFIHRHPRVGLLLMSGAALVFLLAGFEAMSRFVPALAPKRAERARFWTYDSLLGWKHRPLQSGLYRHPDFTIQVDINADGLRDRDYELARNRKKRMLVLGDSLGWGFGVVQEDIFCERIEARRADLEIINASVSGYGTDQELLYLIDKGHDYRPDAVLLLFHPNDYGNNAAGEQYWYNKPVFEISEGTLNLTNVPVPSSSFRQRLDRYVMGNLYFLRLVYKGLQEVVRWFEGPGTAAGEVAAGSGDKFAVTELLIKEMRHYLGEQEIEFLLVSAPMTDAGLREHMEGFAAREGFAYLALDDAFAASSESFQFPHDEHWNAHGHEIAADAVERALVESGVFASRKE